MIGEEQDEVVEFETLDEAIAYAMQDVPAGGVVVVHASDCVQDDEDEELCSCTPLELRVGAEA